LFVCFFVDFWLLPFRFRFTAMGEQLSVLTEENDEDKGRPEMSGRSFVFTAAFSPGSARTSFIFR
jgi:hypothetical protein